VKEFRDLPFDERPDLTPFLIHLTRRTKTQSGFDNLVNILRSGVIKGSGQEGFIKGPHHAACFMDVPFFSLKYVFNAANTDPNVPRYEPYGVVIKKTTGYANGLRPVLYLSNEELKEINISADLLWRVVRLEVEEQGWVSWLHEREWRVKGDFKLPTWPVAVLVHALKDVERLGEMIAAEPKLFRSKPQSILPLTVICQGLIYMQKEQARTDRPTVTS
jgi:hypothetical protein